MPNSKRVLVVGSGGREHAIAWKLARDGAEVLIAPGNAGTAEVGQNLPVAADDIDGLRNIAEKKAVDLIVEKGKITEKPAEQPATEKAAESQAEPKAAEQKSEDESASDKSESQQ